MKLAIISDIHDNILNLKKCLKICKDEEVKKIICCGDVGNFETLEYLSLNFPGEIFLISGNAETYNEKDINILNNINFQGLLGYCRLKNLYIGFCHRPIDIKELIKNSKHKLDYIFYGHTHKPWLDKKNNTTHINPGNLGGIYYQATFALFDLQSNNLQLKLINK